MKLGTLFSGIGAPEIAGEMLGWENIFHCEINETCRQILSYYWPKAKSYEDITTTDFTVWRGGIDVLCGGFPCQKFSIAGSQTGDETLIREYIRAVSEAKPHYAVAENVGNILNPKFKNYLKVLTDGLESAGYETPLVFDLASDALGLPTMERHIWFVAKTRSKNKERSNTKEVPGQQGFTREFRRSDQGEYERWKLSASRVCGVGEGIPEGLDTNTISASKWRAESLQAYGNSFPPAMILEIFKAIEYMSTYPTQ